MELLAQHAGLVMLIAFFLGFVGIACWAYAPANKKRFSDDAMIPFKEDENGHAR